MVLTSLNHSVSWITLLPGMTLSFLCKRLRAIFVYTILRATFSIAQVVCLFNLKSIVLILKFFIWQTYAREHALMKEN